MTTLWRNARLTTLAPSNGWGLIDNGAVLSEGATLRWVGDINTLPAGLHVDAEHDLGGALVTPGLVDCHTHLVYAGDRAREFEQRLEGAATKTLRGPAAASAPRWRPRAPPATMRCGLARASARGP